MMIYQPNELTSLGYAPKNFGGGKKSINQLGFTPKNVSPHDEWKKLPLAIQVLYTYNQPHTLISGAKNA